jgi:hypothetical protein
MTIASTCDGGNARTGVQPVVAAPLDPAASGLRNFRTVRGIYVNKDAGEIWVTERDANSRVAGPATPAWPATKFDTQ